MFFYNLGPVDRCCERLVRDRAVVGKTGGRTTQVGLKFLYQILVLKVFVQIYKYQIVSQ